MWGVQAPVSDETRNRGDGAFVDLLNGRFSNLWPLIYFQPKNTALNSKRILSLWILLGVCFCFPISCRIAEIGVFGGSAPQLSEHFLRAFRLTCRILTMSSLGVAGGAGASPSPVDAPVRIVHAKMASQLSPTARAVSVANGLPTLVCGWFAAACSRLFAERIAPYPDAVPLEVVLTAMRDIRTESVLHPLVEEAMRSTRAWRDAYIAANPAEFKAPDVHLGGSITPTDPSTIRGFSECPAGSWEVSDILRQAGSEPCWQHGVSYLRMVRVLVWFRAADCSCHPEASCKATHIATHSHSIFNHAMSLLFPRHACNHTPSLFSRAGGHHGRRLGLPVRGLAVHRLRA